MPDEPKATIPVNFIDNPHAPDVFADGASGYWSHGGSMRITLESARVNHETSPGPVNRVVVGRLVMPIAAAENMAKMILEGIARLKTDPAPPPQNKSSMN